MADGRTDFPLPVGERLRHAREAAGMSLDDVASHTRVPLRHLEAIERSQWDDLPAPTYSIGFAKSYAEVVGLDRQEIGDELRVEMGGGRRAEVMETFQPADPARVPPRTLAVLTVLVAVILLAGYGYYRTVALGDVQPVIGDVRDTPSAQGGGGPTALPPPDAVASGAPVTIFATAPVWIKVYERSGASLFQDTLAAGGSFEVPATAADPLLRTSRADLLRVVVGTRTAPPVGPANTLVKDVSLRPASLIGANAGAANAGTRTGAAPQP